MLNMCFFSKTENAYWFFFVQEAAGHVKEIVEIEMIDGDEIFEMEK